MKKILTILMFVAIFGMLISSVSAADLHPHDIDGLFTLDVPSDDLVHRPIQGTRLVDGDNNLTIEYFTNYSLQEKRYENFDQLIDEYLKLEEKGTDGNLTIYQDDDGNNVVSILSEDILVVITDDDLEEAKAIASSANFEDESSDEPAEPSTSVNATVELESQDFDGFKMDIPKDSSFEETTDDNAEFNGAKVYSDSVNDVNITFAENEEINNQSIKEMVNSFEEHGVEVKTNGNLNIVSMDPYNEVIFNDGNKIIMIVTTELDLDTITAMAQSVEFK